MGYESREKNSIQNFLKALLLSKDFINNKLELNNHLIKKIHATCREGTEGVGDVPAGEFITELNHGFRLYDLSLEGVKTLIGFYEAYESFISPSFAVKHMKDEFSRLSAASVQKWLKNAINSHDNKLEFAYSVNVTQEKSEKLIKFILEECDQALKVARKDEDIIFAIVHAAYQIEHLHPFKDMNLRTTLNFINLLLMKFGFPPAMYRDPNLIDGCSQGEIFEVIKNGMLTTLNVIENPHDEHFNFSSLNYTDEEKEQWSAIMAPITEQLLIGDCIPANLDRLKKVRERIENLELSPTPPQWILMGYIFNPEVAKHFSNYDEVRQKESFISPIGFFKKAALSNSSGICSSSTSSINNNNNLSQSSNSFFRSSAEAQVEIQAKARAQEKAQENSDIDLVEDYREQITSILNDTMTSHEEKLTMLLDIGTPYREIIAGTGTSLMDLVRGNGATQEMIYDLENKAKEIRLASNSPDTSPSLR